MNSSKQKAMELGVEVYRLVKKLPPEEENALSNKLKLAAIDVATNIAKSEIQFPKDEQLNFLSIAKGKVAVVETLILLCVRINYLEQAEVEPALNLCSELGKQLLEKVT